MPSTHSFPAVTSKPLDARCRMEEHNELDVLSETNYIDVLKDILETFMNEATDIAVQVMNSDIVQDGTEILSQVGEAVSGAIKSLKVAQKIASIPTALYMKKFERYCKGLTTIPLEKRQKYMKLLGKEKLNKESVFVLNVINRIEENEKIPLFLKILNAKMDGFIDDNEYHRLMILTDRTLYSDLLYLKDNITEDPVKLNSDSDYGLLLTFAKKYSFAKMYISRSPKSIPWGKSPIISSLCGNRNTHLFFFQNRRNL